MPDPHQLLQYSNAEAKGISCHWVQSTCMFQLLF